jgi:anthranilate phosphoribosyltransferase
LQYLSKKQIGLLAVLVATGPLMFITGVGTKELGPQYAKTLALNNDLKRGIVIHSSLGVDELCTQGETHVWVVENGQIEEKSWSPKDFGLQEHPIEACAGT